MSDGLNRVLLLGNLCADGELRFTQAGQAVLHLRLATNESYLDKDKVRRERADFHSVVVWGKRAEGLHKFLTKGMTLFVEGSLRTSKFEKDGAVRYKTEIVASNVVLAGGKRDGGGNDHGGAEQDGGPPESGRRPPANGNRPQTSGGGSSGDAGDFVVGFGRDKGKKISEVDDLSWLRGNLEKSLADPGKARWHDTTRKQITSIDAELARRGGSGTGRGAHPAAGPPTDDYEGGGGYGGGGYGGAGDDSDIPFASCSIEYDFRWTGMV